MFRSLRIISAVLVVLLTGGCASRIPTYPWTDAQTAVQAMAKQAQAVHSISARCSMTLVNAHGDSVTLESAIALQPPDRLRLRAWKFGQAVFDLTRTPEGVWVMTGADNSDPAKAMNARLGAVQIARGLAIFNGEMFSDPHLRVVDRGGDTFMLYRAAENDTTILCTVDRATLTVRKYELQDRTNQVRFTLTLAGYRQFQNVVWPTQIDGTSGTGKFSASLDDVEINQPLAPNTFVPPRTAKPQE